MNRFGIKVKPSMALQIKVHPHDQWTTRGSPYGEAVLAPTPCRYLIVGPSGSGKSGIDSAWKPVFKYVEKTLGVDSEQEQWAFDEWDDEKLNEIVSTRRRS